MPTTRYCLIATLAVLLTGCDDGSDRADSCATARRMAAQGPALNANYGFYTDFNPLSYTATQDRAAMAFHQPLGYEPSLVAAVEAFANGQLTFNPLGIGNPFAGIWLKAAGDAYDMVGGGITSLPERTQDADGREVIRFGTGHVRFRQSLLVNADSTINRHSDLNGDHVVATLRGTTGEARLLALAGITDAEGYIRANTIVLLEDGVMLVAGEPGGVNAFRVTAAASSDAIAARVQLLPATNDLPVVRYYDSEAGQIDALRAREADAVARGEIGNLIVVRDNPDEFRVTAIDTTASEQGAFSYAATPAGDVLRGKVDAVITCLTDDGMIGFAEWLDSGGEVFARRAREQRNRR